MFDLIGFAVSSSVFVFLLLWFAFVAFYIFGQKFLIEISDGDINKYDARNIFRKYLPEFVYRDAFTLIMAIATCCTWLASFAVHANSFAGYDYNLIPIVSLWAENTAPVLGTLGIVVGGYYGLIFLGKRFYKLIKAVNKLQEKTDV